MDIDRISRFVGWQADRQIGTAIDDIVSAVKVCVNGSLVVRSTKTLSFSRGRGAIWKISAASHQEMSEIQISHEIDSVAERQLIGGDQRFRSMLPNAFLLNRKENLLSSGWEEILSSLSSQKTKRSSKSRSSH